MEILRGPEKEEIEVTSVEVKNLGDFEGLSERLGIVAGEAFGDEEPVPAWRMERQLSGIHSISFGMKEGKIVAYQSQKAFYHGDNLGLYYSVAVLPSMQGKGVARKLMLSAINSYDPAIIAGRTQNPAAILSLQKTLSLINPDLTVYPFEQGDLRFSDLYKSVAIEMLEGLGFLEKTDIETLVQKRAYYGRQLGNYEVDLQNPEIARIDQFMNESGMERHEGDTMYYLALL